MNRRTLASASFAALAMLLAFGCSTAGLNIENPRYSLRNVTPRVAIALPFSASTIDFDIDVAVDNPNSVGLRLDRIDFDLLVNGSHLVNGTSAQQVRIPANGVGNVHLRTRVGASEAKSLFRQIADEIQGQRADYKINGTAYYNTPAGQLSFPLTLYTSR